VKERKSRSSVDPEIDPIEFARTIALNALSARPKSRRELEVQLARRGVDEESAKLVLDRLATVGLIDDLEFARAWSRSRQGTKGLSRRVLAQELNAKGIDRSIAEGVLAEISPVDEYEAALAVALKKARSVSSLEPNIQVRRIFDLLARKGFSSSISAQIIRQVLSDQK
jgi:regulatory protein